MQAATISGSGAFAWLSSSFKRAKGSYLALARGEGFRKVEAATALRNLAKWKEACRAFIEDPQARAVFGLHFQGVDTDFYAFARLSEFYRRVDEQFARPANRDVRALLKTGDIDLVTSIPELSGQAPSTSYAELERDISTGQAALDHRRELFKRLEPLLAVLRHPEALSPPELMSTAEQLVQLRAAEQELDDNSSAAAVLDSRFNGSETDPEAFLSELSVLATLDRGDCDAAVVYSIIQHNLLAEAVDVLGRVLRQDRAAAEALRALVGKGGSAIADAMAGMSLQQKAQYLRDASKDEEGMFLHSRFEAACDEIGDLGLDWVVDELEKNDRSLDELPGVLEAAIFRAMAMRISTSTDPCSDAIPGPKLDELGKSCQTGPGNHRIDAPTCSGEIGRMANPPQGNGYGRKSKWTEMALLEHEVTKKRNISARDLTRRAGRALLELNLVG